MGDEVKRRQPAAPVPLDGSADGDLVALNADGNLELDPPVSGSLPAGGDTGQVLTKASDADGDADWEEPSGGSSTVQQVTVSLSSAQLLSLFSSPVTLVPAPGAGKAIQVLGVFGIFEAGETPYVDGDGEKIAYATDLFDPVADSPWDMTNPDSNGGPAAGKSEQGFDPSVWLNADVVIGCPTTDPTEGDGTALIVVTFTVIDFT